MIGPTTVPRCPDCGSADLKIVERHETATKIDRWEIEDNGAMYSVSSTKKEDVEIPEDGSELLGYMCCTKDCASQLEPYPIWHFLSPEDMDGP